MVVSLYEVNSSLFSFELQSMMRQMKLNQLIYGKKRMKLSLRYGRRNMFCSLICDDS